MSAEADLAREVERAWDCELRRFDEPSAVEWFAVREGSVTALLQLAWHPGEVAMYPTVTLALRTFMALRLAVLAVDVPAVFVVAFADQIRWIRIPARVPWELTVEQEPVVHIPVEQMKVL